MSTRILFSFYVLIGLIAVELRNVSIHVVMESKRRHKEVSSLPLSPLVMFVCEVSRVKKLSHQVMAGINTTFRTQGLHRQLAMGFEIYHACLFLSATVK